MLLSSQCRKLNLVGKRRYSVFGDLVTVNKACEFKEKSVEGEDGSS